MFSLLHLPQSSYLSVSTRFHLITASSSVFLSFGVHPLPCSHYCIFLSLPIFRCPLTSMFSLLHLPQSSYLSVSTHFHVLITPSSSVFLSSGVHSLPCSHYCIFLSLPIFRCPLTSMFSLLHLPQSSYLSVSTHFYVLITTSSSVFLSSGVHSLPCSHYCIFLSLPIFRCPPTSMFSLPHLLQSSYLSVSTRFHLITTSSSVYIYIHMAYRSRSRFSYFLRFCRTSPSSYFFIPDLLNPLYSHHPSQHIIPSFVCIRHGTPDVMRQCVVRMHRLFTTHSWNSREKQYMYILIAQIQWLVRGRGGPVGQSVGLGWRPDGPGRIRIPLRKTSAIPFSSFCPCLSEETLKAVSPFYLVSMSGEVKYPTSPHWNV